MTYKVYITKNCKDGSVKVQTRSGRLSAVLVASALFLTVGGIVFLNLDGSHQENNDIPLANAVSPATRMAALSNNTASTTNTMMVETGMPAAFSPGGSDEVVLTDNVTDETTGFAQEITVTEPVYLPEPVAMTDEPEQGINDNAIRETITVKSGDSLALIFSRLGLSARTLYEIMSIGKEVAVLKRLQPGQKIDFIKEHDTLNAIEYELDLTRTLRISRQTDQFASEILTEKLDTLVKNASAVINDSLFLSGKRAGLTDNLIMQLVAIYGWDIDFALDIREGDAFSLIYEEQYKNGEKVSDGPIIAAEFVNRNKPIRAIRYTHTDGRTDYYADNGDAMRKAFLRTPVNFTRISSHFNLRRKHPVLNTIRAHRGVDYAAPTGTPVKATGDGTVMLAGRKGGYGRTVILKHGGKYSTLYAHLHRYAKGIHNGKHVKQGQIIGYVGSSGLATGPHLHYEFRLNGTHRNPLTIKLPEVESIHPEALPAFQKVITPMLAELDRITGKNVLAAKEANVPGTGKKIVMEDG